MREEERGGGVLGAELSWEGERGGGVLGAGLSWAVAGVVMVEIRGA